MLRAFQNAVFIQIFELFDVPAHIVTPVCAYDSRSYSVMLQKKAMQCQPPTCINLAAEDVFDPADWSATLPTTS